MGSKTHPLFGRLAASIGWCCGRRPFSKQLDQRRRILLRACATAEGLVRAALRRRFCSYGLVGAMLVGVSCSCSGFQNAVIFVDAKRPPTSSRCCRGLVFHRALRSPALDLHFTIASSPRAAFRQVGGLDPVPGRRGVDPLQPGKWSWRAPDRQCAPGVGAQDVGRSRAAYSAAHSSSSLRCSSSGSAPWV